MATAMTIELSESQMPRPLPLPTFSAPFAAPSLRWACKKRLRCFNPEAAAAAAAATAIPLSPSADSRRTPSLRCDDGAPLHCAPAALPPARPASSRSPPLPPPSPPCSDWARNLIPIQGSRREEDVREEPPDLSSGAKDVGEPRPGGEAVGWSLRSRARWSDEEMGSGKTKRRRVELWVSLSRDEIEGDFFRMAGSKLPRRPRRGGRAASNLLLQGIFPGSCLPTSVTADRYKVSEPLDSRKR